MCDGHEKKELARARLREMGKLVLELQSFDSLQNATLADCLKPRQFQTVISAV